MGLGLTLHNEWGEYIYSRTYVMPGVYKPEKGEAIGLHEALSWIKELGLERVIIEMDAKMVVDAMNHLIGTNSTFETIIDGCKLVLRSQPHFFVK